MYKKILVAVDGSESSKRALAETVRLAALLQGEALAVYVIDEPAVFLAAGYYDPVALRESMDEEARLVLTEAKAAMDSAKVVGDTKIVESVDSGSDVATALKQAAREYGAELVVMGTHGRRGVRRLMIGSVAERYLRVSSGPVLLIRADDVDG
jgi:nucleotide-binding universal stress UspA family protein